MPSKVLILARYIFFYHRKHKIKLKLTLNKWKLKQNQKRTLHSNNLRLINKNKTSSKQSQRKSTDKGSYQLKKTKTRQHFWQEQPVIWYHQCVESVFAWQRQWKPFAWQQQSPNCLPPSPFLSSFASPSYISACLCAVICAQPSNGVVFLKTSKVVAAFSFSLWKASFVGTNGKKELVVVQVSGLTLENVKQSARK